MLSQKKDYAWIMQALVFAIYICISHANGGSCSNTEMSRNSNYSVLYSVLCSSIIHDKSVFEVIRKFDNKII